MENKNLQNVIDETKSKLKVAINDISNDELKDVLLELFEDEEYENIYLELLDALECDDIHETTSTKLVYAYSNELCTYLERMVE